MKKMHLESYVINRLKANYYASICKDIAKQIENKQFGLQNGKLVSEDTLAAEYLLSKHSAIRLFAATQTAKEQYIEKGGNEEELSARLKEYVEGQIFRDDDNYSSFKDEDSMEGFVNE